MLKGKTRSSTMLSLFLAACCLLGTIVGIVTPKLGVTYGLISNSEPRLAKGATYTTLSGSQAFLVSPGLVDLGETPAGSDMDIPGFLSIINNTGDKTIDLTVSIVLTGTGTLQDVQLTLDQSTIIAGDVANVSLTATAGDPGDLSGWFHVTGLEGFLTLDIPFSGSVSEAAPAPAALLTPEDAAPTPDTALTPDTAPDPAPLPEQGTADLPATGEPAGTPPEPGSSNTSTGSEEP